MKFSARPDWNWKAHTAEYYDTHWNGVGSKFKYSAERAAITTKYFTATDFSPESDQLQFRYRFSLDLNSDLVLALGSFCLNCQGSKPNVYSCPLGNFGIYAAVICGVSDYWFIRKIWLKLISKWSGLLHMLLTLHDPPSENSSAW